MSEENVPAEPTSTREPRAPGGVTLRGTPVAPGLALGVVHRKDHDLLGMPARRVPLEQVERELNRFHKALSDSKRQIEAIKSSILGKVPSEHARILDTHLLYLKDSVFLSDVENLILNEQMALEAAIGKVVADFDRIFRLVKSETLRERAVDLRDVGIRVLRNLEQGTERVGSSEPASADYILVARELSIVDMFNLANEHVRGILTEAGGLTSHAAILARSMRIPTLTGVAELLGTVNEGDFVILDATEGLVRVNPDEVVRAQYKSAASERESDLELVSAAAGARISVHTRDGQSIELSAACGNLPEVEQALAAGVKGVGLYRTELLYLLEREQPSLESLVAHYSAVVEQTGGASVTFRLLHVDSSLEVPYLHEARELNPALGRAGVRALLGRESVLRRQIQAFLRAVPRASEHAVRIAVPLVSDCGDLRRIKEVLFEERYALRKAGVSFQDKVELGAVIETPIAALGAKDLAREADFLAIGLDSLVQYLLAADRENHELHQAFDLLHPFVLRAVMSIVEAASSLDRPLSLFGASAGNPAILPFLLGAGIQNLCLAPVAVEEVAQQIERIDLRQARRAAAVACKASCVAETLTLVEGYRHGYAPGAG